LLHIYDPAVRYIYDQLLVDQQRRGTTMTIEWEESEDDWQERYGISDELAEEMGEYQELGFHALEYGPASDAVRAFLWLVEQWKVLRRWEQMYPQILQLAVQPHSKM
jgi:hypothetical protein